MGVEVAGAKDFLKRLMVSQPLGTDVKKPFQPLIERLQVAAGETEHGQKTILLVRNNSEWVFGANAREIIKHLPGYRFDVVTAQELHDMPKAKVMQYAGIYLFFWKVWHQILRDKGYPGDRVVVAFCSWGWRRETLVDIEKTVRAVSAISVNNDALYDFFLPLVGADRIFVLKDGVDTDMFYPATEKADRPFTALWAGNPDAWQGDLKGTALVKQACKKAGVELKYIAKREVEKERGKPYTLQEMAELYRKVDVVICASAAEGTPKTVLEGAATGLPVVTTPVGIVMELLNKSHGGIVAHRDVGAIANALLRLKGRPEIAKRMGKANREWAVKNWQWKDRAKAYGPMFEKLLENAPKPKLPVPKSVAVSPSAPFCFPSITPPNGKPRIMLATDHNGWAFSTRALACKKYLSDEFDLQVGHWPTMIREGNPELDGFYMFFWRDLPYVTRDWPNNEHRGKQTKRWPRERLMSSVTSWSSWTTTGKKSIVDVYEQLKDVAVVATQNKYLKHFLGTMFTHVFVTENGIDTELFHPGKSPDIFTPMWAGNLEFHLHPLIKGVQFFLDACKKTGIKPFLIEKSAMEKKHGRILTKQEMALEYRKASVYVHPSAFEGCSNTLLEAAAAGLPCICTNTGVVDELFKDGGAIIVTQDVNEIAEALTHLKNNPDVARKMGEHNRENVLANWTWEKKVQSHRIPYRILMGIEYDENPTFSVLMLNYNKGETIKKSLASIGKAAEEYGKDKVELIFMDEGSTDGSDLVNLPESFASIKRIRQAEWRGARMGEARNAGARLARFSNLQFFDPDIHLPENYFVEMAKAVSRNGRSVHMPHVKFVEGIPTDRTVADFGQRRRKNENRLRESDELWKLANGGVMCVPRKVFDATGGFNEPLDTHREYDHTYMEDTDYALKAHTAGFHTVCHADIVVEHVEHKRRQSLPNTKRAFEKKWGVKL